MFVSDDCERNPTDKWRAGLPAACRAMADPNPLGVSMYFEPDSAAITAALTKCHAISRLMFPAWEWLAGVADRDSTPFEDLLGHARPNRLIQLRRNSFRVDHLARHPAVDHELRAGYETAVRPQEKSYQRRHILNLSHSASGMLRMVLS